LKFSGAAGIKPDICRIQVYAANSVQTGRFNGGLNYWFHAQEPLFVLIQADVTNNYHALNQDTTEQAI